MVLANQDPMSQSIEKKLQEAQALEVLQSLRKKLAEQVALERNQKRDQTGQTAKTRSYAVVNHVRQEITRLTKRYQKSYSALKALDALPHSILQELKDGDTSAKNVFQYTDHVGRGTDTNISWIWRHVPVENNEHIDNWLDEGT
jgi:hypothetical protein